MAKTKQQVIDSILEQVSAFELTDDNPIDRDWLGAKIDDIREKLILEQFNAKRSIDDAYYELDCCVEIECAELAQCSVDGITFSSGEKVYWFDASNVIGGLDGKAIKSAFLAIDGFGNDGVMKSISLRSLSGFNTVDGLRYTRNSMFMTVIGAKGYVRNLPNDGIRMICVVMAKRSPGSGCGDLNDVQYPVPDYHKLEYIARQEILNGFQFSPDRLNDMSAMQMQAPRKQEQREQ